MCVRAYATVAAFLCMLLCSHSSMAALKQHWCEGSSIDEGNVLETLGKDKPASYWTTPCRNQECAAIKDINCASSAQAHLFRPNTMAYHTQRDAEYALTIYNHNIGALGHEHPDRIPLYCTLLARVAATITGDAAHDRHTAENIIELAIWLNRPDHPCLAQVLDAVPQTAAAQKTVEWGRDCLRQVKHCQARLAPGWR